MVARRRKLLLADDSPTIQKVVSLTFSDEGMEVAAVGSGDEALAEIGRQRPDVVLADVHMPGVGGYELCERIKRDPALAHIPVVLLVGAFEPFSEAEARRVGADEVLTKPFQSIKELVGKVGSLFGGKQPAEDEQPRPPAATAAAPAGESGRDERPAAAPQAHAPAGAAREESATRSPEPAAAFNDFDMDDRMIEARPAEGFGGASSAQESAQASGEAAAQADAAPHFAPAEEESYMEMRTQAEEASGEVASGVEMSPAPPAPDWGVEVEAPAFQVERRGVEASVAEARAAAPAFSTRLAGAAAADDVLLDLGGIDTPPAAAESDDFILDLDLDDDAPAVSTPAARTAPAEDARPDAAGAFAEAAHGAGAGEMASSSSSGGAGAAGRAESSAPAYEELAAEVSRAPHAGDVIEPRVVPADEPGHPAGAHAVEDLSVEGDIARPPLEPAAAKPWSHAQERDGSERAASEAGRMTSAPAPQLDANQLPPEVVEAIARRAVEMLSERVVREIAWEVVPELAERLIKQRLDEIAQK